MKINMNLSVEEFNELFAKDQREIARLGAIVSSSSEKEYEYESKIRCLESDLAYAKADQKRSVVLADRDATLKRLSPIFAAVLSGQKINAIKLLRELMGCGLKEAKDTVEGTF